MDLLLLTAFLCGFWTGGVSFYADALPSEMTKMVVRLSGPGIQPNSNAALPKTIYFADPHFARIEDPPDARQGIQKLTIIAEPDAYSVNLMDKKGTHAVDEGGANDLHLPIVLPFDPKHRCGVLDKLEFGTELEFFKQAGAKQTAGPIINAQPTDLYTLKLRNVTAWLVVRDKTQAPVTLSWDAGAGKYTYEYIAVEDLPFDRSLFSKPAGIAIRDIKPDQTSDDN
jgi:hypothetical protein